MAHVLQLCNRQHRGALTDPPQRYPQYHRAMLSSPRREIIRGSCDGTHPSKEAIDVSKHIIYGPVITFNAFVMPLRVFSLRLPPKLQAKRPTQIP